MLIPDMYIPENVLLQHIFVVLQGQSQHGAQAVTSLWQNASTLRNSICSFAGNHKVPGVRLNATKFMEQVVLTFTAENVPVLSPGARHMRQQPTQSLHGILTSATVGLAQ